MEAQVKYLFLLKSLSLAWIIYFYISIFLYFYFCWDIYYSNQVYFEKKWRMKIRSQQMNLSRRKKTVRRCFLGIGSVISFSLHHSSFHAMSCLVLSAWSYRRLLACFELHHEFCNTCGCLMFISLVNLQKSGKKIPKLYVKEVFDHCSVSSFIIVWNIHAYIETSFDV